MHTSISNLMERKKIISVWLYIFIALVAVMLPLSYAHATSIGTNVTVSGNTTLGDAAASDTLTVTARLASNLNPSANNTYDLGAYGLAFKNIFASSTAFLSYVSSTALNLANNLTLTGSTIDSNTGVIYKGTESFIHNFSHPTGSTAIPIGQNTFIGLQAGNFTMGSEATNFFDSSHNTGIGYKALNANTTGYSNTANGVQALYSNTTGYNNTANGLQAFYYNTTGYSNTANGLQSLYTNTTGYNNTANGMYALYTNSTGYDNTASGYQALYANTTGKYNIAMGYEAGRYQADGATALATASSSIYIGSYSKGFNNSDINSIVIGDNAVGIGANTVVLGNDSILTTALKGNVGVTTSTPRSLLQVSGASGATTSTIWAGDLWGIRGQFCMGDSDGSGASCFYMNDGVITGFVTTTY